MVSPGCMEPISASLCLRHTVPSKRKLRQDREFSRPCCSRFFAWWLGERLHIRGSQQVFLDCFSTESSPWVSPFHGFPRLMVGPQLFPLPTTSSSQPIPHFIRQVLCSHPPLWSSLKPKTRLSSCVAISCSIPYLPYWNICDIYNDLLRVWFPHKTLSLRGTGTTLILSFSLSAHRSSTHTCWMNDSMDPLSLLPLAPRLVYSPSAVCLCPREMAVYVCAWF